MFYNFKLYFYNITNLKKNITEKVCLVVLHGLAAADAIINKISNNSISGVISLEVYDNLVISTSVFFLGKC